MAIKKSGEPGGRLGNQGYQEGNEGRDHNTAEGQRQDLGRRDDKVDNDDKPVGSEGKIKGHQDS